MPEFCLLIFLIFLLLFFFFFNQRLIPFNLKLLLKKLLFAFELSHHLAMWILDFLLERPERVYVNDCVPDTMCISTGSPQGCVLCSLFFVL